MKYAKKPVVVEALQLDERGLVRAVAPQVIMMDIVLNVEQGLRGHVFIMAQIERIDLFRDWIEILPYLELITGQEQLNVCRLQYVLL